MGIPSSNSPDYVASEALPGYNPYLHQEALLDFIEGSCTSSTVRYFSIGPVVQWGISFELRWNLMHVPCFGESKSLSSKSGYTP